MADMRHETKRALDGHGAGPGLFLGYDGARPKWQEPPASGLVIVSDTEPASPATGQLWYAPHGDASGLTVTSSDTDFAHPATTLTTSPSGIAVGDLLVTFLHFILGSATVPAGWTAPLSGTDTFKAWACLTKTADAGDVGATFTWTASGNTGNPMHAATAVISAGSVTVSGASATNGGGQIPETPSVTAPGAGLLVAGFVANRGVFSGDPTPLTVPSGMTHQAEIGGAGAGLMVASEVVAAGATGTRVSSTPYSPSYNVGMAVVVGAAPTLNLWDGVAWVAVCLC